MQRAYKFTVILASILLAAEVISAILEPRLMALFAYSPSVLWIVGIPLRFKMSSRAPAYVAWEAPVHVVLALYAPIFHLSVELAYLRSELAELRRAIEALIG